MNEMVQFLPGLLLVYAATFLSLMSPGPNIMAVIGTSMSVNRRSGLALATGVASGSFCWAVLTVVGLSALLSQFAYALTVIKIVGGLYLLWLAYKSFRAAASYQNLKATQLNGSPPSPVAYYLRGLFVQMTNPKAAFAWIAITSLGLEHGAPTWVGIAIIIGTFLMSLAMHWGYAIAFSTPLMVRVYSKSRRYIQFALGSFFAFAGIKLLRDRL